MILKTTIINNQLIKSSKLIILLIYQTYNQKNTIIIHNLNKITRVVVLYQNNKMWMGLELSALMLKRLEKI